MKIENWNFFSNEENFFCRHFSLQITSEKISPKLNRSCQPRATPRYYSSFSKNFILIFSLSTFGYDTLFSVFFLKSFWALNFLFFFSRTFLIEFGNFCGAYWFFNFRFYSFLYNFYFRSYVTFLYSPSFSSIFWILVFIEERRYFLDL